MNVQRGGRQLLLHGIAMILTGLVWGLVVPVTPFPRLALTAHIQFEVNGMMFAVLAVVLLAVRPAVGARSLWAMVIAAWSTWAMLLSEVANAWWGTNQVLPIAAQQAGATGGAAWQEAILKVTHVGAGLMVIVAWGSLLVGFLKSGDSPK